MRRWIYWTIAASIALGALLRVEVIWSGYRGDDFVHRAMVHDQFPAPRAAWDMFRFAGPHASDNRALIDFGYLPWWSSDDLSLAMLRPLPSLLITFDHLVLGDNPWLHHVHSLCWWVAACLAMALLLFRFLNPSIAALALLLLCIDEAFSTPFSWLANRSTLVAITFGSLALYGQHRFANEGKRRWLALACASLSLAMTAGEYAFGMLGYMFVLAATSPRERRFQQGLALGLPAAAYLVIRSALHFGTRGSGFYLAPFSEPLDFLAIGSGRIGILASDLWLGISAPWSGGAHPLLPLTLPIAEWNLDLYRQLPSFAVVQAIMGGLLLLVLLRVLHRHYQHTRDRNLWTLGLGSVLALLPSAGSIPEDRLLCAAAIGQSAVIATLLVHAFNALRSRNLRGVLAWTAPILLGVHVFVSPVRCVQRAQAFTDSSHEQLAMAQRAELPTEHSKQTRAYIISAPNFTMAANLPFVRQTLGLPAVQSYRRLHGAIAPLQLRRPSQRELELRVLVANVGGSLTGTLYRRRDEKLHTGDRFKLPGLDVEIIEAREGDAYRTRYTFDRSLDDPTLWLLHATAGRLRHLTPPAIGETVMLRAAHY